MAKNNERIPWKLERLAHASDPAYKSDRPDARDLAEDEEARKFRELMKIRDNYKWEWNAGARYLYAELIRAYGLEGDRRESLLEMAKSKPGRKHEVDMAVKIASLKQQGMTAIQIKNQLECEGRQVSLQTVESYSKRRREPSAEEWARIAVERAFRRGKSPGDSSR